MNEIFHIEIHFTNILNYTTVIWLQQLLITEIPKVSYRALSDF